MNRYAELHAVSNFSFLRGASHPEELVNQAAVLGYDALALTDECSLAGVVRAHVAQRNLHKTNAGENEGSGERSGEGSGERPSKRHEPKLTIPKLIIGSEIRLSEAFDHVPSDTRRNTKNTDHNNKHNKNNKNGPRIVLLAPNQRAYAQLSGLITRGRRAASKGEYRLGRADIEREASECLGLLIPDPPHDSLTNSSWNSSHDSSPTTDPMKAAAWFSDVFSGRGWISAELLLGPADKRWMQHLQTLARHFKLPLVASGDVHMHQRSRRALQDVLTSVRYGVTVQRAGTLLHANGERHLRPINRLESIYPADLIEQSVLIAERCNFSLDELRYEYPRELVPDNLSPENYLLPITEQGIKRRWPQGESPSVRKLVEHELSLIRELDYERYFLTVYDIVKFAKSQDILCQGRGSAANSAVCYCLGITEVDPARMTLLFERFISKERNEPPDIDVDFEHERREEVIQYIYKKYGRSRAALAATVVSYRPKSALRDVGKTLGLSIEQVDRLSASISWWDGPEVMSERIREAGFDPDNPIIIRLLMLVNTLIGFPRHLSQHVGGFIISDQPLSNIVPVENAAMADRTVIQWDKDDIEALGLMKIDCLALGMLSAIHRALDLVAKRRGYPFAVADVPAEDPAVYRMIQRADTIGVFQIESRAQMSMLPRLKPACFYDLVIEVAIVRPGPIQGDMVHPYLRRRQGLEKVTYPNAAVRDVLERTLGVPIFQEQVIKLAMVAAGFTPGEADGLRRSMAAWKKKGGLEPWEKRLKEGMSERGYDDDFADRVFKQIMGFGEYGFPESHSASFSLLVYISAWLKCHEPAAFTCALLNSQPMGFYAPAQLINDAKKNGHVRIRPVDVNQSDWDCTLEPGDKSPEQPALRLGLRMVKGLSTEGAQKLLQTRTLALYRNSDDLATRSKVNRRDLEALAGADALRALEGHRHLARWNTATIERSAQAQPAPLIEKAQIVEAQPLLRKPTEGENIIADFGTTGLTLRRHPLALLRDHFGEMGIISAGDVDLVPHGEHATVAGLVITRQRPASAKQVCFVTLEDETGHLNAVVWKDLGERQRRELTTSRLLAIYGEIQREDNVTHIIAKRLEDLSSMLGELVTQSRDFR